MNYLITGGTGFVGAALIEKLCSEGHSVIVLTRLSRPAQRSISYVTDLDTLPADTPIDAVINLAGAGLAAARWTRDYKREIVASRLETTEWVVRLLGRLERRPEVLLSASAIGYYGHHGGELLSEDSDVKEGFSHQLCQRWEAAAMGAAALGIRVCLLRLGVVLDREGGAMEELARPYRYGVANWVGDGHQWLSWVHRRDVIAAMDFLLERPDLSGPFNITAPDPVTSRGFCEAMKQHRRTLITLPVPALALRLLAGEMAEELLLNGQRVLPTRLEAAGFQFESATLKDALSRIMAP